MSFPCRAGDKLRVRSSYNVHSGGAPFIFLFCPEGSITREPDKKNFYVSAFYLLHGNNPDMKKNKSLLAKLITSLSGPKEKPENILPKGQYPFPDEKTFSPVDGPLSTRNAVKAYKQSMLAIGYLEKGELSDFVRSLQEEIEEHEQHLNDEISWAKDTLADARVEAKSEEKRIKQLLSGCEEDEKEDLNRDLESSGRDVNSAADDLARLAKELAKFKKDKRSFLVNYINTEVHGHDWKAIKDAKDLAKHPGNRCS